MTFDALQSKNHKGVFVWNVPTVDADPVMFTVKMLAAGITDVAIKIADGTYVFSVSKNSSFPVWGENLKQELVDQLHKAGIRVWGWIFLYGKNPKGEGKIAGMQVERLGLDGIIFDQETSADNQPSSDSNAVHTCQQFRLLSDKPIILCWWALHKNPGGGQQWHPDSSKTKVTPKQLIASWEPYVSAYMPMVYWSTDAQKDPTGVKAAVSLTRTCYAQYRSLTQKPIIPAGRSYTGDSGVPYPSAMKLFAAEAMAADCAGLSWWVADQAVKTDPLWETIGEIYGDVKLFPLTSAIPSTGSVSDEENPSTGSGSEEEEEVIHSTWRVVKANHVNLRLTPRKVRGNERGGLMCGDEVEVLPGRVITPEATYVPVVMYVAEDYLE